MEIDCSLIYKYEKTKYLIYLVKFLYQFYLIKSLVFSVGQIGLGKTVVKCK